MCSQATIRVAECSPRTRFGLGLIVVGCCGLLARQLPAQTPSVAAESPILILIGGNHSDPSADQIAGTAGRGGNSGLWRLKGDLLEQEKLAAEYFNWNGTRAGHIDDPHPQGARGIARLVHQQHAERPRAPIVLVGNSWGGHTAWQVCRLLAGESIDETPGTQRSIDTSASAPVEPALEQDSTRAKCAQPVPDGDLDEQARLRVDLLVLLDPSSFGRGKEPMPTVLPDNVTRAVNFHTRNTFGWRGWLEDSRLRNVDLGDPASGFLIAEGPRYDSALNWTAHVSAEWDERVHAAIRGQIIAALHASADAAGAESSTSVDRRRRRE